ncbi:melatonin receptor type 1C-like [Montipora capricornis]|uniref:melatonin receptor type 1C-like n=1 Tax=Montipora foliosa TaxID=591990 RepID=UPI0035F15BDB
MPNASERERLLAMSLENRGVGAVVWESMICAFIVVSAFLGNTVLCLSLYKTKGFQTSQNYYITCLAVTDLLYGALCMSFSLGALVRGKWVFGDALCQSQGSLIFISVNVSLFTMTLIAINRYFKICRPIHAHRKLYNRRNITLSVVLTWVVSIALVLVLFSFTNQPFRFHPGKFNCFFDFIHGHGVRLYMIIAYCVVCVTIFPVITFCYLKVYRKVREHFAEIAKSELMPDDARLFIKEAKITKMLFITVVAFLACWTPSVCLDLFEAIHGAYSLPRQVYYWQVITFSCSSAINPVIYGFMRKELRLAYKNILTCR